MKTHLPALMSLLGVLLALLGRGCAGDRVARHPFTPPAARAALDVAGVCPMVVATEETVLPALRGGGATDVAPVNVFLVKARGVLFLVDAGLVPRERSPRLALASRLPFPFDDHPRSTVVGQLREAGIAPDALSFILLTHAHGDHAGELEDLPGVPVVVSPEEAEWIASLGDARSDVYTWRSAADWAALSDRLRILRWADEPVGPLPRSADLFGDGTVVVLPTPGHTPGSVSVLLRTAADGRTLLLGDAALNGRAVRENLSKGPLGKMMDVSPSEADETRQMLHLLARDAPRWTLWAGHDPTLLAHRNRFVACARALRGADDVTAR